MSAAISLLHALSAAVLLAGGGAIGARLLRANLGGGDRRAAMAAAARLDAWAATPAALLLPLTAAWLLRRAGPSVDGWLKLALALSLAAGLMWLAASAMRRRMAATLAAEPFDAERYRGLFGLWFLLGWPALPAAAAALLLAIAR